MGLRGLVRERAEQLADTAVARAKDAALNGDNAVARLLALLEVPDDRPLSIETFAVMLVDAVRGDESAEIADADVVRAAKRRQRRVGVVASLGGPTTLYIVSLYCEVAILCDVERARGLGLTDAQIAAHLLVIWRLMPDYPSAAAAIDGQGTTVAQRLAAHAHEHVVQGALDDAGLTKTETVLMAWRARKVAGEMSLPGSIRGRDVLLPGSRVRELKRAAEEQLKHARGSYDQAPTETSLLKPASGLENRFSGVGQIQPANPDPDWTAERSAAP